MTGNGPYTIYIPNLGDVKLSEKELEIVRKGIFSPCLPKGATVYVLYIEKEITEWEMAGIFLTEERAHQYLDDIISYFEEHSNYPEEVPFLDYKIEERQVIA